MYSICTFLQFCYLLHCPSIAKSNTWGVQSVAISVLKFLWLLVHHDQIWWSLCFSTLQQYIIEVLKHEFGLCVIVYVVVMHNLQRVTQVCVGLFLIKWLSFVCMFNLFLHVVLWSCSLLTVLSVRLLLSTWQITRMPKTEHCFTFGIFDPSIILLSDLCFWIDGDRDCCSELRKNLNHTGYHFFTVNRA